VNESQLFANVLKLATPAERAAYLDEACAGNPQLRADVEALLRARASDPDFLERPAAPLGATADLQPAPSSPGEDLPAASGVEQAGVVLGGRYKLLEAIGEGGMGTVWMAQQTEPVKRLVAVKLIKAGLGSRTVLARFEAERQALALMDHPNIAKVLDAGAAPDGRPFVVMELVKGVPITRFCDEHYLTPRQRLELFIPVCQAIQHAHQKGIIHRDLKPSNVLVALYDEKPVPKVIDFGVAKAAGQPLTEETLHTGFGAVVGTVEYMSPEQASFNQLDVDTRSDVYALGVLLYELLAGSPPFSRKDLEKAGVLEMLRLIREQEPSKPSVKLSTAEGLPSLAANRGTEPARLTRLLRGELDWIVMKALEKDRNRRYETANGFAMDVQHYLADEPVLAGPPSWTYRLRKFLRRNRGPVLAAAVVLLALVGGIIGMTVGLVSANLALVKAETAEEQERGQRRLAEQRQTEADTARTKEAAEHARAEQQRQIAEAGRSFLQHKLLDQADVRNQIQELIRTGETVALAKENPTIRELLDRAARELTPEQIDKQFPGQPLVQAEILQTVGKAYRAVGAYAQAVDHLRRAHRLERLHLGADHRDTVGTLHFLMGSYLEAGDLPKAFEAAEQLRAAVKSLPPGDRLSLALLNNLGVAYSNAGKWKEAIRLLEEARDLHAKWLGPTDPFELITLSNLAVAYQNAGQVTRAVDLLKEVYRGRLKVSPPDHPETLTCLANLAGAYREANRRADAIRLYQQVWDRRVKMLGIAHPATLGALNSFVRTCWADGKNAEALHLLEEAHAALLRQRGAEDEKTLTVQRWLAAGYRDAGKVPEAIQQLKEIRQRQSDKLGPDHPSTLQTMIELSIAYFVAKRFDLAIPLVKHVLEKRSENPGLNHPDTLEAMARLAVNYRDAGRASEAVPLLEAALAGVRKLPAPLRAPLAGVPLAMAVTYDKAGLFDKSEPLYRESVEQARAKFGDCHPETADALVNVMVSLFEQKKFAAAEAVLRECLAIRKATEPDAGKTFYVQSMLGCALQNQKKYAEAEPLLLAGYEGMKRRASEIPQVVRHERLVDALRRLVALYAQWGKQDQAARWRKELTAFRASRPK
jgi:serine/threonine protein kinase/tetratricopeptide (TPR) repeat protein